jgi:recombination protein RecA
MAKNKRKVIQRDVALENLKGFVKKGSEVAEPEFISTGHPALDLAIAHGLSMENFDFDNEDVDVANLGGLPLSKLAEVFGPEGSGKSSIAYRVTGFAQKLGYNCLWIDAENSFSRDLAEINGVDLDSLMVSELYDPEDPDKMFYAEDIMENICTACKSGFQVIVLDSVAALTVKAEMENEIGQGGVGMGALAQLMARSVKKVCNYAAKYNVLVIMINQVREKIGVMFGDPETTPGGKALKFHASIRLRFQKGQSKEAQVFSQNDDGSENLIAGKSFVQIKKNRFGKPVGESIQIPIYYEAYFPNIEEVIFDAGRQTKLISVRKGVYSWDGIKGEGRKAFLEAVITSELLDKLAETVKTEAKTLGVLLSPEMMSYEGKKAKPVKADKTDKEKESSDAPKVQRRRSTKNSDVESEVFVESGGTATT